MINDLLLMISSCNIYHDINMKNALHLLYYVGDMYKL